MDGIFARLWRSEDVSKRRVSRSEAARRSHSDAVLLYSTALLHFIRALCCMSGPDAQASCKLGDVTRKHLRCDP
jgi:hypothetical protein